MKEDGVKETIYNGTKTELAEIFWKGYYTRTSDTPDEVVSLYVTRTLNSHIFDYIEGRIKKAMPKDIIDILENITYWETCPGEYRDVIIEYLRDIK